MRVAHAVLLLVVLGAGVAWWQLGHPGYETREQKLARVQAAQEAAKPKIYRWRDGSGVLHISDQPPEGGKYEQVELQEDVNVIPMPGPEPKPAK